MKDVDLIDLVATTLESALAAANLGNIPVLQKNQPNQQGLPVGGSVWLYKLFDQVYGWPALSLVYDEVNDKYIETETQIYTSVFQISALFPPTPGSDNILTASDVLIHLQQYLTSRNNIRAFKKEGVSFYRVTSIQNPAFSDDQSQFEYHPNFQISFNHRRAINFNVGAVKKVVPRIIEINNRVGVDQINSDQIILDND